MPLEGLPVPNAHARAGAMSCSGRKPVGVTLAAEPNFVPFTIAIEIEVGLHLVALVRVGTATSVKGNGERALARDHAARVCRWIGPDDGDRGLIPAGRYRNAE